MFIIFKHALCVHGLIDCVRVTVLLFAHMSKMRVPQKLILRES